MARILLEKQNGETKPGPGTIGCRMWNVMDATKKRLGRVPSIAELQALPEFAVGNNGKPDLKVNVSSIYARWRKFNGISGRITGVATEPAPQAVTVAPTHAPVPRRMPAIDPVLAAQASTAADMSTEESDGVYADYGKIVDEDDESAFPEGRATFERHRRLERDSTLSHKAKSAHLKKTGKLECEVCAIDFHKFYGEIGAGFIEAHHRIPVHQLDGTTKTKLSDLALVCSNCHRMLHRATPQLTVEKLRDLLNGIRQ
ncbi:HNH endonuclease [Undibacterium sp. Ji83W]|uniref:HNH endonuclease n=1 Tax=Undibacterium sp. Ji83W TaxID=3413043 RepID=UPI003BF27985